VDGGVDRDVKSSGLVLRRNRLAANVDAGTRRPSSA
jgi:hypothetical protein